MNEDYLWDKSGEPDPQIQELEQILGTLRYQPKPLKLPNHRSHRFPLLAIAATVVFAVLAAGLWLQIQNREASIPPVVIASPVVASPIDLKINPSESVALQPPRKRNTLVSRRERQEALAAKQQLMFALKLASEKLNLANKRTQSSAPIKNQHRAG